VWSCHRGGNLNLHRTKFCCTRYTNALNLTGILASVVELGKSERRNWPWRICYRKLFLKWSKTACCRRSIETECRVMLAAWLGMSYSWEGANWIRLVQNSDRWLGVKTVVGFRIPSMAGNRRICNSWGSVSVSKMTLIRGINLVN